VRAYLTDDDLSAMQRDLLADPEKGAVNKHYHQLVQMLMRQVKEPEGS
jgi:hypothetical protein